MLQKKKNAWFIILKSLTSVSDRLPKLYSENHTIFFFFKSYEVLTRFYYFIDSCVFLHSPTASSISYFITTSYTYHYVIYIVEYSCAWVKPRVMHIESIKNLIMLTSFEKSIQYNNILFCSIFFTLRIGIFFRWQTFLILIII